MLTGTHPARFAHTGYSDPSARCTNPPGVHTGHPCHICNWTGWARPCLAWARPRAHLHRDWAVGTKPFGGTRQRTPLRAQGERRGVLNGYSRATERRRRCTQGVLEGYSPLEECTVLRRPLRVKHERGGQELCGAESHFLRRLLRVVGSMLRNVCCLEHGACAWCGRIS